MLIVIPSLILLFIAIIITFAFKFFWKKDELKEKRVVKEQHLFNRDRDIKMYDNKKEPECC